MDESSNWLKNTLSDVISTVGSIEMAKVNNQAYVNGQPATTQAATTGGINPVVLLLGAGVILVLLLKD